MSEYDDLLHEVRIRPEAYRSTAKEYIPKMYEALRKEDVNISPEDARDRIEKDCFGIWSKRTILNALPQEAKNPEKQKAGRLRQKGHNSAAFSAAQKRQDDKTVIIDVDGKAVETNVTSTLTTNDTAIRNSQQEAEKEKEKPPVDTTSNKIAGSVVGHPSNYTTPDRKLQGIESEQREDSMKCVSQETAQQEATVFPQPGPGIGIGGVGQQPVCGYCPTKDSRIIELEGVMAKKDHEVKQLNERIRKLEQKQKQSSADTIPTAANEPNKANLKTNVLNQEIVLPCRKSRRYISSQLNKGKNEFYIGIEVNLDTGKIISARLRRNSERETNSFRVDY